MPTFPVRDPDGIHNFRQLGPYPLPGGRSLREGMIYRSGALEQMSEADHSWLRDEAGVRTILDLRHPDELAPGTGRHALEDRVHPLSIFPEWLHQQDLIAELNGLYGPGRARSATSTT